jgi:gluconokinase
MGTTAPLDPSVTSLDRAERPLVLALDIGTSSIRSLLFDRTGKIVDGSEGRHAYSLFVRPDGTSEADPLNLFALTCACLDEAVTLAGSASRQIAAVAASAFASSLVGVDAAGQPVTPLVTYADTRPAQDAAGLRLRFDEGAVHDRTGCPFHPAYLPARFAWMQRARPGWLQAAERWLSFAEFLALRLFGETAASYSLASWTGLLDRRKLAWDKQLLTDLSIPEESLSRLVDSDDPLQGLQPEFAARWPALKEIPWFPSIGDGAAANIGSGCVSPGRVSVTVGTSSAVRAVLDGSVEDVPQGLWCYRVDRKRSLLGGALNEGGNLFAWLTQTLGLESGEELDAALAALPPDGHGLTLLPLLAGERSPGWRADLRGAILGLSLATNRLDLLRAGLEGVAFRLHQVYQVLRQVLPGDHTIVASGAALLRSPTWMHILADVLGLPVAVSKAAEASARGAALAALVALGALPGLDSAPDFLGETIEPDFEAHAIYQAAVQRQEKLYGFLAEEGTGD